MPEGDTIYRAATRLRPILEGQTVRRAESRMIPAIESLTGHELKQVEARGKHLLFHFDDGRVLHSHMGMTGSWHIYRHGETWQKPPQRAAVVLENEHFVVVCFTPKTLELLSSAGLRRHSYLRKLGPDLLGGNELDDAEVLQRFRAHNPTPIGEAILNQTIVSGVGNVYKSEVLFLLQIHPLTLVRELSDEKILEVTRKSQELMQKNLEGRPRTTRYALDGRRQWVYGRSGEACFRCSTRIEVIRQGDLGRTTYFCPQCQPRIRVES